MGVISLCLCAFSGRDLSILLFRGAESVVMKFHGNVPGEVRVNFLALFPSKPHIFICSGRKVSGIVRANVRLNIAIPVLFVGADFREGDEDSNFSVFTVRRFTESPGPLHCIAFPVEILTKNPTFTELPPPFSLKTLFFALKSASLYPLPKNRL